MTSKSYYTLDRKSNPDPNPVHSDPPPFTRVGPEDDGDHGNIGEAVGGALRGLFGTGAALWGGVMGRTSRSTVRREPTILSRIAFAVLAGIAGYSLSFLLPDIPYQLRMFYISHFTKLLPPVDDEQASGDVITKIPSVVHSALVLPTDIDGNFHMNNARYIRELNFARRHCFYSLGIWQFCNSHKINLLVRAQSIRHRRELRLWDRYTIVHKIAGWSKKEKCFYIEAHFMDNDSFVCAVQFCKYSVISGKNDRTADVESGAAYPMAPVTPKAWSPSDILAACGLISVAQAPSLEENVPEAFARWEESNKISSQELRPEEARANKRANH